MLINIVVSLILGDESWKALGMAAIVNLVFGGLAYLSGYKVSPELSKRDGYIVVTFGWILMAVFSMLPYLFSGAIENPVDAFFESMSGLTTTGASILNDIESIQPGILFWRSLTQWIGGMGIIVLTVAIFPLLGVGGFDLFAAEAPGPTSDKISPRIADTAKILWGIYFGLTVVLTFVYFFCGMSFYDAINHSLTTMSTGGFSTHNDSMIGFSPTIQYVAAIFMIIAGLNYSIIYLLLVRKFKKAFRYDELKMYLAIIALSVIIISIQVWRVTSLSPEQSFRDVLFQISSLITTTGYVSADYTSWTPGLEMFFFILLFLGACAGSTSGGIKIVRHYLLFNNTLLEFKRILHPRGIIRLKLNGQMVTPKIITHIIIFLLLYMAIIGVSAIVLTSQGLDIETALGAAATSLGNVGPAIGQVGPMDNFSGLPAMSKLFLTFIMLVGRLELFSVLILFTTYFWKTN